MKETNKPEAPTPLASPRALKRDEALVERFFRRIFESMGAAVDRRFGREANFQTGGDSNLSTSSLIERMKRAIDEQVFTDPKRSRIAPHLLKLKIEWGTHSEAPSEALEEIEHEIAAAAIDHINDNRYRTFAPVRVETSTDIFTTGINVEPSFAEFESEAEKAREGVTETPDKRMSGTARSETRSTETKVEARLLIGETKRTLTLTLTPDGRRINIGRAADNDVQLDHPSVSKIHSAMRMNADGTLIIADTGSTNGTFINGRRIAYGEARAIEAGDTVAFGDVEARFSKI